MIALAEAEPALPGSRAWQLLRDELSVSPERWSRMLRMTALVAVVIIVSMALRVPSAAVSAFLIFFVSGIDVATTVRTGIGGIVGAVIAIALTLVLYSLALAEPALRLLLMACLIFGAMYYVRVSRAGPLAFIIGFVVSYALTFPDRGASPERLTRSVLWTLSFFAYPVILLVISDLVLGRRPAEVFREGVAERLEAAADFLTARAAEEGPARTRALRLERAGTGTLAAYLKAAPPGGASILRQLDLLFLLIRELPAEAKRVDETREALVRAGESCRAARGALLGGGDFAVLESETRWGNSSAATLAVVLPLLECVKDLELSISGRMPAAGSALAAAASVSTSKTEAAQFAAKVTLAAMIGYVIYTSLAWPGIHTAMLTCMIVSQATVGATIHKLSLRIAGAVAGGALGILAIVFVLPQLETVGGLVVVVGVVTLFAAWIATASPKIAYAGIQIAFAFYLTVLQGFSRTSEMVVGRDRAIGIILGNVIVSVVFTTLWPVRIKPAVRKALSRAVEALAAAMRATGPQLREAEAAFHTNLRAATNLAATRRLEPGDDDRWSTIPVIESLFVRIHAIAHRSAGAAEPPARAEGVASWLSSFAAALAEPAPVPPFEPAGRVEPDPGESLRSEWLAQLETQIERFAARERALT